MSAAAGYGQSSSDGAAEIPAVTIGAEGRPLGAELTPPVDRAANFMHGIDILRQQASAEGVLVGIWDGGPVLASHAAFGGRVHLMETKYLPNYHATHVAGIIAAAPLPGVEFGADIEGVSTSIEIASYDFCDHTSVPAELRTAFSQYSEPGSAGPVVSSLRVTNHSWGISLLWGKKWATAYGELIRGFDEVIYEQPEIVAVVAAGNEGKWTPYSNVRSPGAAKNVLTVGAMVDLPENADIHSVPRQNLQPTSFSSVGPAPGGRIKPEVIANGKDLISPSSFHFPAACYSGPTTVTVDACNPVTDQNRPECMWVLPGTSMATPLLSGVIAFLQRLFHDQSKQWLRADDVKAILVHSAISEGSRPTYRIGWGPFDAPFAGTIVKWWSDSYQPGDKGNTFTRVRLAPNEARRFRVKRLRQDPVRLTAAWLDAPSGGVAATDGIDLVIDVNLSLRSLENPDAAWLPWTLDPRPGHEQDAARRGVNIRDPIERIDVSGDETMDGTWELTIAGNNVPDEGISVSLISQGLIMAE